MEVKILGSGCPKCQRLEQLTRGVADDLCLSVEVEHVRDIAKIMQYAVLGTPALVVNGQVKASGRMPSKDEIGNWLREC
jgi:small redox-active disulfide protein 2